MNPNNSIIEIMKKSTFMCKCSQVCNEDKEKKDGNERITMFEEPLGNKKG